MAGCLVKQTLCCSLHIVDASDNWHPGFKSGWLLLFEPFILVQNKAWDLAFKGYEPHVLISQFIKDL
jgi:hypothetical protein